MSKSLRPSDSRWSCACRPAVWFLAAGLCLAPKALSAELLPPGFRPLPLGVHALAGGKVVIKPGEVLEHATIVIRDGFIQAVGPEVAPPADARVWDLKGLTIYAGFIDPYLMLGFGSHPPRLSACPQRIVD